ncbi:MAG: DUF935 domain-containing protein [Magnetospiraceae bacterium]
MAKAKIRSKTAPIYAEIAASGSDAERYLNAYVQEIAITEDPILKSLGGDLSHYERLLTDPQIFSTFQQRRRAVTSTEWEVEPGGTSRQSKKAADFLRENLSAIKWDRHTDKMLYGLFYGFAVGEMMWMNDGAHVAIDMIKVRKAKRFLWGVDGGLRLRKKGHPKGVGMPDRKFWTYTAGADNDDEPHGIGLGHYLYWPVWFTRNGAKFWALALEKFGGPTMVGKHPAGATEEMVKTLLQAAMAARTDAAVAIPEGMALEVLESARRAGGDFQEFLRYWDAAKSKIIVSQTMTTDDGSSLAQGQVHMDVRQDVVKGDADLLCESFNEGPATWLTEWNFPGAEPPRVWRITEEPEDLNTAADRDQKLYAIGWEPSGERVKDTYGDGYEKRKTAAPDAADDDADPKKEDDASFAEPTDAFERFIEEISDSEAMAKTMGPVLDPLIDLVNAAQSYEELTQKLPSITGAMQVDDLAESLARALFAANIAGRVQDG